VEALPAFLKTDDPAAWLDGVIEELSSLSAKTSSLRLSEDAIATTACRASVKSHRRAGAEIWPPCAGVGDFAGDLKSRDKFARHPR
jgi:DNA mismatch repair ATPase MutL